MRRLSVAVVVVACLSGMWSSARVGAARLLASGDERARTPFNELALRLSPDDPLVHYKHAKLLKSRGAYRQSAEEFERAVRLRPDDFMSWLNLGGAAGVPAGRGDDGGDALAGGRATHLQSRRQRGGAARGLVEESAVEVNHRGVRAGGAALRGLGLGGAVILVVVVVIVRRLPDVVEDDAEEFDAEA